MQEIIEIEKYRVRPIYERCMDDILCSAKRDSVSTRFNFVNSLHPCLDFTEASNATNKIDSSEEENISFDLNYNITDTESDYEIPCAQSTFQTLIVISDDSGDDLFKKPLHLTVQDQEEHQLQERQHPHKLYKVIK